MKNLVVKAIIGTDYNSNCYIIHNKLTSHAIIIDPNDFCQIYQYFKKHDIISDYIILTHEHYDHVAALAITKKELGGVILCSESCEQLLDSVQKQLKRTYRLHMHFIAKEVKAVPIYENTKIDHTFNNEFIFNWYGYDIQLRETIGHSKGSISIYFLNNIIFTGDALSYGKIIVTKMLGGNRDDYIKSSLSYYKMLPQDIVVYPGHGRLFLLKEKSGFEY